MEKKNQIISENEVLIPINIDKDSSNLNRDYGQREEITDSKTPLKHKPHVTYNSGNNEWYTPAEYMEAVREVMGSIDLDPASCETANQTVKAANYYTAETNGLENKWYGNIFLNPPYASRLVESFIDKLVDERDNYQQAIVLVNNATETKWFYKLIGISSAVVFPKGRIKFYTPSGKTGSPLQGQAIVYIGNKPEIFVEKFKIFGWCAIL